jgi:S-DNA-T family DNA segregation ATPase FtsK/SpoIIIE
MLNEEITIQKIIDERLKLNDSGGIVAPIGINKNNQIQYADYSKITNLLICGTTGSGKTTFVRTLIASLTAVSNPNTVKFCIFDSRGNDYIEFLRIPNLLIPIIHDAKKCVGMLSWALYEAKKRMTDAQNDTYPDIFIVLDDYVEIAKELETQETLYELLHIAHRVKIHVVIVTSLALAKIVSTELKVHIPHRIAFFLPEKINSRVAIDENGAESLEMPGEFIAKFYSKSDTYRAVQLSDAEIKNVCNPSNWEASAFDEDVLLQVDREARIQSKDFKEDTVFDEMLPKAIEVVIEAQYASITILQRRLKIGYARAARIVDEMEEKGIVGPYAGSKPRAILITKDQWDAMRGTQPAQMSFDNMDVNSIQNNDSL